MTKRSIRTITTTLVMALFIGILIPISGTDNAYAAPSASKYKKNIELYKNKTWRLAKKTPAAKKYFKQTQKYYKKSKKTSKKKTLKRLYKKTLKAYNNARYKDYYRQINEVYKKTKAISDKYSGALVYTETIKSYLDIAKNLKSVSKYKDYLYFAKQNYYKAEIFEADIEDVIATYNQMTSLGADVHNEQWIKTYMSKSQTIYHDSLKPSSTNVISGYKSEIEEIYNNAKNAKLKLSWKNVGNPYSYEVIIQEAEYKSAHITCFYYQAKANGVNFWFRIYSDLPINEAIAKNAVFPAYEGADVLATKYGVEEYVMDGVYYMPMKDVGAFIDYLDSIGVWTDKGTTQGWLQTKKQITETRSGTAKVAGYY